MSNLTPAYDWFERLGWEVYLEVMGIQLEKQRMRTALNRIAGQKLIVK